MQHATVPFDTGDDLQCRQIPGAGYQCQCVADGVIIPLNGTECIGELVDRTIGLDTRDLFILSINLATFLVSILLLMRIRPLEIYRLTK